MIEHIGEALAVAFGIAAITYALLQIIRTMRYGVFPGAFNPRSEIDAKFDVVIFAQRVLLAIGVAILAFFSFQHVF